MEGHIRIHRLASIIWSIPFYYSAKCSALSSVLLRDLEKFSSRASMGFYETIILPRTQMMHLALFGPIVVIPVIRFSSRMFRKLVNFKK